MKRFLYLILLTYSFGFTQNETLFNKANALYNEGDYTEAIKQYEAVLASGEHSAELYFNLGNAHYKLDHIAPSIFNYERALLLSPKDKDIKNNLAFAKNMTIDAIDVVPEVGFSKILKNLAQSMGFDAWAIIAIAFMFVFVGLFLWYYFAHTTSRKRFTFVTSTLSIILMCFAISMAFINYGIVQKNNPAIVFAQEAQVKSEPNLRSTEAFKLHEGTKLQVLDTVNNWKKIQLTDGKTGWIPSEAIKLIKQF